MKVAVLTLFTAISLTTTALESQINLNQSIVLNILPSSLQIGDEIDISVDRGKDPASTQRWLDVILTLLNVVLTLAKRYLNVG